MTSNFERNKQAEAHAAQSAVNTDSLRRWLAEKHPEIPIKDSTIKAFQDDMGDMFFTIPVSDADFQFSLDNMETNITPQRVPSTAEVKEDLVNQICDLLRSPNSDGRGGRYSDVALSNECKRLQTFTTDQLVQRRDSIIEAQRLQKLSAAQIRQELAASRHTPQVKVLPAEYTKKRIHAMPPYEIKKLIRDYTASVVNDRIFGRN
jgi:hypothetical protein